MASTPQGSFSVHNSPFLAGFSSFYREVPKRIEQKKKDLSDTNVLYGKYWIRTSDPKRVMLML